MNIKILVVFIVTAIVTINNAFAKKNELLNEIETFLFQDNKSLYKLEDIHADILKKHDSKSNETKVGPHPKTKTSLDKISSNLDKIDFDLEILQAKLKLSTETNLEQSRNYQIFKLSFQNNKTKKINVNHMDVKIDDLLVFSNPIPDTEKEVLLMIAPLKIGDHELNVTIKTEEINKKNTTNSFKEITKKQKVLLDLKRSNFKLSLNEEETDIKLEKITQ